MRYRITTGRARHRRRCAEQSHLSGTPALEVMLAAGARAVQSTPLVSRSGRVLGMFSTHYRRAPQRPSERALRLLDILARQAADLIEQKQSEESRALLAGIVDSSDDAIISKNLNGIITSWNAGAERIFGYTAAEAIGQSIILIIPPERRNEETEIIRRLSRGSQDRAFRDPTRHERWATRADLTDGVARAKSTRRRDRRVEDCPRYQRSRSGG